MDKVQYGPYTLRDSRKLVVAQLGKEWVASFPARTTGSRANNRRKEIQGRGPSPLAAATNLADASAAKFKKKPARQAYHRATTLRLVEEKLLTAGLHTRHGRR